MSFRVAVDWDKTGDFTTYGDDVTSLVRRNERVSLRYGRDQDTAVAPVASGQGALVLNNADRRFSPRNTASPLYGKVRPGRPVRITRTVGATTYALFQGSTDDSPINPDRGARSVSLSLVDALAAFNGDSITTRLYRGIRTGDAIGYVLDEIGWSGGRDLDPGATVIPWWWEDGDVLGALDKILKSEGPPALLTVGSDGEIVFRDRHHRLTRAASLSSQGTWRSTGSTAPVMTGEFAYEESWRNIINTGFASVDVRTAQNVEVVWSSDSPVALSNGEQKMITVSTSDPFFNAIVPVAGKDYTMASGTVTMSLTRTSGVSTAIVITAVGGPAVLATLSLRANTVTVSRSVLVSASDPESIEEYGRRAFPNELPWCGPEDAQAVLSSVVALRSWPLATVTAQFQCAQAATANAILARDLSDRVTVVESETLLNAEMFIESIQHDFAGDHDHIVTCGLEAVPSTVTPVLRFDTAGQGFTTGKFGAGLDDPANMFRFDSTSGHRFDEGVFAQ